MEPLHFCQNCGMPIESDEMLGTKKDGKKNSDYCTNCYKNGAFIHPGLTIDDMITCVSIGTTETVIII